MVRAKFKCGYVEGTESKSYRFDAVSGGGNEDWAKWTPCGTLHITIDNPDAQKFEVGKEYYLDFSPAE